ncbi:type II toxin-antitoxin system HicB family antitoxin [Micromonospora sp. WMMD998]|uniref:type II toxin-antitoxin system HicB family antitoxin n=1 Tax=Micromonospora sp. WMMD998 TaxID=3016092 RepID=UPI00249C741D|nr:type II toxin-antitoxin system HicB family antitoxin [Micromonospora sp. WMMD998]WFE39747.1 type II toxin-antitoxin system HicB family antitoxin [Micromonospora sp. WMMD998]
MARTFTAAVHQEDDWYVARCLEIEVASQGETVDAALTNLREAVGAYLEEVENPEIETTPLVTSFQAGRAA